MKPTILMIDDDEDLRGALAEQLSEEDGFLTLEAENGYAGLRMAHEHRFDLVLLDVDMPDLTGYEVCAKLRERGVKTPIIMLTGRDTDTDTVTGLDAGANDYISKPFKYAVLLARIRAQLRAFEDSDEATLKIGPYEFKPAAKMLLAGERKIKLTEKETGILKYLYRAKGKTASRQDLLENVWGYNSGVDTHTIETHVYRLRKKIEPKDGEKIVITDGGGYKLAE